MVISEVRVDLITIYTTLHGLSGMKKSDAPFSFLLAKRPYKGAYEKAAQAAFSVTVPPLEFQVLPICPKNDNNFWNGAWNRRYEGYVGLSRFSDVAWEKFLPFLIEMPLEVQPGASTANPVWTSVEPRVYLWSCGWGGTIQLTAKGQLSLEDLAALMQRVASETFVLKIGADSKKGTVTAILQLLSDSVQDHIYGPTLAPLASRPTPERFGPFFLISIRLDPPAGLDTAKIDEQSARLIYSATTRDPTWQSYNIDKIRAGFKIIDTHPDSFIFADRMARLFWFPHLTHRQLSCYIENTKSAIVMLIRLEEFVRLLINQQTGASLRANYPLRDLFQHALTNIEQLPSFYKNTNLKRLTTDLTVSQLVTKGRSLLS
jgi:hypothetical protein